jgi:hypothetical protein
LRKPFPPPSDTQHGFALAVLADPEGCRSEAFRSAVVDYWAEHYDTDEKTFETLRKALLSNGQWVVYLGESPRWVGWNDPDGKVWLTARLPRTFRLDHAPGCQSGVIDLPRSGDCYCPLRYPITGRLRWLTSATPLGKRCMVYQTWHMRRPVWLCGACVA